MRFAKTIAERIGQRVHDFVLSIIRWRVRLLCTSETFNNFV